MLSCSVLGHRCFRYEELPEADPSNKLWVGQNPTDAVEEEPDAIPFDLEGNTILSTRLPSPIVGLSFYSTAV
jgi:hypothetical protein